MTAQWTAPRTWVDNELVSASQMNQHLRDNLEFLKTPPTAQYKLDQASDYTTTSTTFVDVDATNLALTITTAGGDVLIGFYGTVMQSAGSYRIHFDVALDGVRIGGDDGLCSITPYPAAGNVENPIAFIVLKTSLAAGSHTFKLQWKVSAGTGTLFAGAGTTNRDLHPQFWVREVS